MIEIKGVSHAIDGTPILGGIDITIPKGGITALIGPNGAGKSTLLSLIARLDPVQTGAIRVDGLDVTTTPTARLAKVLAILRQQQVFSSRLTVRQLVGFGRFPHSRGRLTCEDHRKVEAALSALRLEDLADRFLDTLSGGQRQRALVAMSFAQETDYLLLDEPLNNLDMAHARALMEQLRELADRHGRTVVIVLHEVNYAAAHADRIVAMQNGRIAAEGTPARVLTGPQLSAIFGTEVAVHEIGGRRVALHHGAPPENLRLAAQG
ncbi:iron ABC transporter ATP-binding protein [Halovulum sp. GXIMD14794]